MDCTVHGVAKSQTRLRDFHSLNGEPHREETCGHGEGRREGEMCGESNMETYSTIGEIDSQWEFAVTRDSAA